MKTIGLIGGISWVSTLDYYRIINTKVNERLGGVESAKIILHSLNYGEIVSLTQKDDWEAIAVMVTDAAQKAQAAGADCILLCANTMHKLADKIQAGISIPIIHIAEATAKAVQQKELKNVLLLGTRYTMSSDFYPQKLQQQGVQMVLPKPEDWEFVNNSIYNELGKGVFLPESKKAYLDIINESVSRGAQGVILGCTEIPLLIKQEDSPIPVFDTALLHAMAAVNFALS